MIDIAILALPANAAQAGRLLDAFKSRREPGGFRVQFAVGHPHQADWRAKEEVAEEARAVLICCSHAVLGDDATLFRALAVRLAAAGRAILVELEPGSVPPELAGCSTYRLYGHQAQPRFWSRLLFGHPHINLIVAAATDKAEGRDPPSETAIRTIRLTQLGLRLLPVLTIIGLASSVIGLLEWEPVQKWRQAEIGVAWEAAKAKGCPGARAFAANPAYQASPWDGDVTQYLAGCPDPERIEVQQHADVVPFFLMQSEAPVSADIASARSASLAKARSEVELSCRDNPANAGASEFSITLSGEQQDCGPVQGGFACSTSARAVCTVKVPVRVPDERVPNR